MTNAAPSRPRKKPWGLIGAVVLTFAIEGLVLSGNPAYLSLHGANWQYANRYIDSRSRGKDVLCFGDSLVKFGVLPPVLSARTGLSSYNFAITLGPAPASYVLFRRALEQGAHPKAVIVDFVAGIQKEGPTSPRLKYPWADLLGTSDALELAWMSRSPDLFFQTVLGRWLPSTKNRFEIREAILDALNGESKHRAAVVAIMRRNWSVNQGAQANVKVSFPEMPPPSGSARSDWACNDVNEIYVRRFMSLAARHEIPVYWVIPPVSPMAQAHNAHGGEDERYNDFVRRISSAFANVTVLDGRPSGLDRTFFFDDRHLDLDGGTALSLGVGSVLSQRLHTKVPGPRWIELTGLAANSLDIAIEDSSESSLVFKSGNERRRR